MSEKFCANCKYMQPDESFSSKVSRIEYATCGHPNAARGYDMVTGIAESPFYCRAMRKSEGKASCGAAGKFFHHKDDKGELVPTPKGSVVESKPQRQGWFKRLLSKKVPANVQAM